MKLFFLLLVAGLSGYGEASGLVNYLFDEWLEHARSMMKATRNNEQTVEGLHFITDCGAFITTMNCTANADMGVVRDLTTLKRLGEVIINDQTGRAASIEVILTYDQLKINYPNMLIAGEGIRIVYKNITSTASDHIPLTLSITLDYSGGDENCKDNVQVSHPDVSALHVITTIQNPPAVIPLSNDLTKNIVKSLLATVSDHIVAIFNYEKVCTKFLNVI